MKNLKQHINESFEYSTVNEGFEDSLPKTLGKLKKEELISASMAETWAKNPEANHVTSLFFKVERQLVDYTVDYLEELAENEENDIDDDAKIKKMAENYCKEVIATCGFATKWMMGYVCTNYAFN